MADQHKKAIVKFKKSASAEDKSRIIDDLKAKGAQVTNGDNVNSSFFPFVAISLPEEYFHSLHSETIGGGHDVVDLIEEDQEVHIQS